MRFDNIISLPSGNTARGFNVRDLGNGRVRIQYVYTDRRRAHQVSRHFTAEFLNGKVEFIQARSANSGRIEYFSTSTIINELLEMLSEFESQDAYASAKIEETETSVSEDDTALLDALKMLGGMMIINIFF